jgi:DNA ligase D-like protein (predicted 3'-phosphoesterase)
VSEEIERYRSKRDFRKTDEPSGDDGGRSGDRRFVIQKHDASTLHYDFRVEADGVLKSWAVPKGPSTDPREKRLAVRTEDHPVAYADFEGVIPEGEYGAGTVLVWDAGTYENLRHGDDGNEISISDSIRQGQIEVRLDGDKLEGGYALVHAKTGGDEENWLLVKMDDDGADARRNPVSTEPDSVLSGRSLEQIAAEEGSDETDGGDEKR